MGPPADVFASADAANMSELTAAGYVVSGTAQTFARNVLEIVVKAGNPKGIQSLSDLARQGVVVVLGDPSILPAGGVGGPAPAHAPATPPPPSRRPPGAAIPHKAPPGHA